MPACLSTHADRVIARGVSDDEWDINFCRRKFAIFREKLTDDLSVVEIILPDSRRYCDSISSSGSKNVLSRLGA